MGIPINQREAPGSWKWVGQILAEEQAKKAIQPPELAALSNCPNRRG